MHLQAGGTRFRLRQLLNGKAVVENLDNGQIKEAYERDLVDRLFSGELTTPDLSLVSKSLQLNLDDDALAQVQARGESDTAAVVMLEKYRWVRALRSLGIDQIEDKPWVQTAISNLAKTEMLGARLYKISTLSRADRALRRSHDDPMAVLPHFSARGGPGIHRVPSATDRITMERIENVKRQTDRVVVVDIVQDINDQIDQINLSMPDAPIPRASASTVTRRLKTEISAYEICRRNQGRAVAKSEYRDHGYSRDRAEFPLEVVEFDDTDMGVFLINHRTGLPFGRAHLTSGIDQNTLAITGFDLSHKDRSIESALGAIADCLLPKDYLRPEFAGVVHPWFGYGCPGTILLDNARYNNAMAMERQSQSHQLMLAKSRPYTPTAKSAIEHFNGEVKHKFCVTIPGWRGKKHDADSVKDGINSAICTEDFFLKKFVSWVTGVYANKPGEDGMTPNQRWNRFYHSHRPAVRWSREQLAMLRMIPETLKFRPSGGLERMRLRYDCQQLDDLRRRIGSKGSVDIFTDPSDLSYLVVGSPYSDLLFRVPCTEKPFLYQGITQYQQELITKMARQNGARNPSLSNLVTAREDLRQLTAQLATSKKLRSRKRAEKTGELPECSSAEVEQILIDEGRSKPAGKTEYVMTELEWQIEDLKAADLNLDDGEWGRS
jgi:putative transposase